MRSSPDHVDHASDQSENAGQRSRIQWWAYLLVAPELFTALLLGKGLVNGIGKAAETLSSDNRNDPIYLRQLQDLIERNRQFEKPE